MSTPFCKLLAPLTVADFFADYWERQFLHLARADAAHYADVLTVADLDAHWQSEQVAAAFVNVVKAQTPIELARWTRVESSPIGESVRVAEPEKLFALFQEGATLVVNRAHRAIPRLSEFCHALTQELAIHARANVYITPPHAQGFERHYDAHDILILQISGAKRWRLYDTPVPLPTRQQPYHPQHDTGATPNYECTLQAGDLLYLPRGLVHEAAAETTTSIHISLGLQPAYWFDLVGMLATLAAEQPTFRHALPHAYSSDVEKRAFYATFQQAVQQLVAGADWPQLVAQQRATDNRTRPTVGGHFQDLVYADELTAASVVRRRPTIVYEVERTTQGTTVVFGERRLTVPALLSPALVLFFQDRPFAVGEMPGLLTPIKKVELVRQFVKAGFLMIER